MRWFARCCTIALVVLAGLAGSTAHARTLGVISSGGDLLHIRDLPAADAATLGFDAVGYHYETFGVLGLDIWRWDGALVLYKEMPDDSADRQLHDLSQGTIVLDRWQYVAANEATLAALGDPPVPWSYHAPPGLLLILALVELAVVAPRRRGRRLVLVIAAGLALVALLLFVKGAGQASAIPFLLAVYHAGVGWLAGRSEGEATVASDPAEAAAEPARPEEGAQPVAVGRAEPRRLRPGQRADGPFRMPPQARPIVVERPPVAARPPAVAAAEGDEAPAPPTLLR